MLLTLGVQHDQPMFVQCDSKSAIYTATNPLFHERTKHIEINLHFVRDEVLCQNIHLSHVVTNNQLADILTKPIGRDVFGVSGPSWAYGICILQLEGGYWRLV